MLPDGGVLDDRGGDGSTCAGGSALCAASLPCSFSLAQAARISKASANILARILPLVDFIIKSYSFATGKCGKQKANGTV
jgi:hypothetical protein